METIERIAGLGDEGLDRLIRALERILAAGLPSAVLRIEEVQFTLYGIPVVLKGVTMRLALGTASKEVRQ